MHRRVKEAADHITGRLPTHSNHPQGRIPMAHIYQVIQTVMGRPSRECGNDRLDDILNIIQDCIDLVDVMDVSYVISHKYQPEAKIEISNLRGFFD